MSPLVLREKLGVFINTLSADGKYRVWDCENFPPPIQLQWSEKQKVFLNFSFHFWNLNQNLNILKK